MTQLADTLRSGITAGDAVIRIHATLETGAGNAKVLPPTYVGGKHNMTAARTDGSSAWCSLDSPASVANRIEAAIRQGYPDLAPLRVEIGQRTLSTLDMPHRAFDAILRESRYNGIPWSETEISRALSAATPANAYALLRHDPGVLLFGGWDSTKLGQPTNAAKQLKLPAALSCEITATDVLPLKRAKSRIDPLGIEGTEACLVEQADGLLEPYDEEIHGELPIRPEKDTQQYPRRIKPSHANLGNVAPDLLDKGVLVRGEMRLDGIIDLRRLARYGFAPADDVEAHLLLALMGLYGIDALLRRGLDLRRDCELIATQVDISLEPYLADSIPLDLNGIAEALSDQIDILRDHIAEPIHLEANAALKRLEGLD
ncbi:type I-G CRISPR-associated RAMP protein Csb1/Cas7g [Imhoffiella purpurea]|uniref:Type I-U CRISPR-associated protein Cas7 n=1 Tax=Imhoffiella purpurea TaxID=1249627 RepID=W9VC42_9GAMM|nr:type I-U CRISPR-associated RAMP protein Csb1/Cas7u [Imhoffiella purpurea]EXJ13607.1 hypothetical protein D779_3499 [Imhoffiella purpurea]